MHIQSLYEATTARIIAELEAGAIPWTKPWKDKKTGGVLPYNGSTFRSYSGANILLLWAAREVHGYPTPAWMTFQQAREKGGTVRKGEKGNWIVFTKTVPGKEDDEDDKGRRIMRTYCVFNEAQIEGLPAVAEQEQETQELPETTVDRFVRATGADVRYGGNKAMYVPSKDFVALPLKEQFATIEHHHATALHELAHWTGHESRLNRQLKNRFGSQEYAAEELVAELASAFLCAHLGVEGELRHAGYVENWLKLLKEDDRAIFTAASLASKSADYLRSFGEQVREAA